MSNQPVYDAMLARRSIRRFLDTPVPRECVDALLRAAMAAPSACNLQPWAFVVVDDADALNTIKQAMPQGDYNAPLAIVVCGDYKHIPWEGEGWLLDCGMAAQNIMLAATERGLASVCIGGFDEDALRAALALPDGVQLACVLEIGYPAYARAPRTWYDADAVHWQKFDANKKRVYRTLEMLEEDIKNGII